MLDELYNMGIDNFITFDAHDPRVANSIPLSGFDNYTPPYQFIKALLGAEDDLIIDKDHLVVISPDEGALDRSVYFANVLGVNGMGFLPVAVDLPDIAMLQNNAHVIRPYIPDAGIG
jgi:ribose-phosphate pyrophosphokinase